MKLKLIEKRDEAHGTKSFFWLPDEPVSYYPGQYFYFTLPSLEFPDRRGPTRHLTISSSQVETRLLRFTTRMRKESGFKMTLDDLPIGTEITGTGPNGTFFFDEKDTAPHILIAGGIGITTFRSMISYNLISNLGVPMYLLYGDTNEEDFTFNRELTEWDKVYDYFSMTRVITSEDGRIDGTKIGNFIEYCKNHTLQPIDIEKCSWWVCGPPSFVDAVNSTLEKVNIPTDRIRSEKFTGY